LAKTEDEIMQGELQGIPREKLLEMLRWMVLSRRFEEKTAEAYQTGKIGGFCHLYIGQEAVGVGAITALREDDYVFTAYRDHAQALVRGVSSEAVMAELYGRSGGTSRGAGGSMHIFDRSVNFMGGHGIVGTHLPLAAGVGYAIKYRGGDQVVLCFFGDSVVNGGPFHESFNMVAKWELPVVYIVENNSYGMGTDIDRVAAVDDLMDVLAVHDAMTRAVKRARETSRPTFIEARTYRFLGHSMSDPAHGTYRTREEVQAERKNDPINSLAERMEKAGLLTDEEYKALDAGVIAEVERAAEFAEASPLPGPDEIYSNVYADEFRGGLDRRDAWR